MAGPDASHTPQAQGIDLRLMFDSMVELAVFHEMVYAEDGHATDYRILECNSAFSRVTGIPREKAVGRLASEVYGGPAPYLEAYARVAATGEPTQFNTYFPPMDRHFSISVVSPRQGCFATIAADVTDRERAIEALRRYELLSEYTQDIVLFVRASDGRVLDGNKAAHAAYGYTPDQLRRLTVFDLRDQATHGVTAAEMAHADGHGLRFETTHRRRDGTLFPVEVSSIGATFGSTRVLLSLVRDITARKMADEALRASEERLRVFVGHSPAAIAMFDREMRYLVASRRYVTDYRLKDQELLGRSHYDVFPEIPERWKEIHRRCLAGAMERCDEDPFYREDGTVDWVRWEIRPWRDGSGGIGGITLFSEVITERKQSAEKLAAERERLAVTLKSIGDAVIATDRNAQVTDFNVVAEQLTGWPAENALGRPLAEVFHIVDEETDQPAESPVERVLREGVVVGLANHTALVARDGTVRPIADSGAPIRDSKGLINGVVLVFRDQTIERRVEKAQREAADRLARSEEQYRLLAEHARDVIWRYDLRARRFAYISPSIQSLRGLSVAEALAEPLEASLTAESMDRVLAVTARIGTPEEEDPHTGVYDQPCRDGTVKHVEMTSSYVRDSSGQPVEVVGVSRDVTARVRAERALEERERHLRTVLETSLDGFWITDESGHFLVVNDAACQMYGYGHEEFLRMSLRDLEVVESGPEIESHIQEIKRRGSGRMETRHRCKNGRIVDVEASVRYVTLDGGRLVCFVRDVTTARRARAALLQSEERFRALIEKSTDMILVLDEKGRYQFWSQGAVEALGWTSDEKLGRSALEMMHPDDRDRIDAALARVLSVPGGASHDLLRYRHKDGSWRDVEATARNLLHDPAVRGVVVNSRDVTRQLLLESQLRQAQKLEGVGRLAGGIAHDFNNLLTVILGCSEALREQLDPRDLERQENVGEIRAAGERARDLTRQLLAFARKQVVAPVPLDLNSVVQGTERMLGRLLGEDVKLTVTLEPEPWIMRADPGQVEQVILNLAVNARDAMPKGGTLVIETRNGAVSGHDAAFDSDLRPGEWVQLFVRDTGVGITPEVQAHLFEPFFTTKEQGKGTGLGLATVYGIVTQAGGHIHVRSLPGQDTTFQVCFPRVREALASTSPIASPRSTKGAERVLVVEDERSVRDVVVRALRAEGYEVCAVEHPEQALELSQEKLDALQLLVTDVVMPGINGQTLAMELRRRSPALRLLYLSGYAWDAISERGELDPGVEFLAKPFTRSGLLAKVRAILDASQ